MTVQILQGNRFRDLPGAVATHVTGNAWEVSIPRTPATERHAGKKGWRLEAFDDAVLLIDDTESMQVIGTRTEGETLVVTALLE